MENTVFTGFLYKCPYLLVIMVVLLTSAVFMRRYKVCVWFEFLEFIDSADFVN